MFESAHSLEGNGAVLPFGEGRPERRALLEPGALLERAARSTVSRSLGGRPECRALHARLGTSVAAAEERARRAEAIAHALERWGARAALSPRVSRPPGGRPFF